MSEFVRFRDCACPDTPHAEEGDGVYLPPTLPAQAGIAAEMVIGSTRDDAEVTQRWLVAFVRYAPTGWNVVDAAGKTLPYDADLLVSDWTLARPVAIRAGELYADAVMAPFLQGPPRRSPTGRTRATTSRRRSPTSESPASP